MSMVLTEVEARILGSLVEKSLTTPDQYPLSLNALVNACNQKTSREPVMNLEENEVARALATLQERGLVGRRNEPGGRVNKYLHHIEILLKGGTTQEIGAVCVLLLRGPQTPGEIKGRTDRLCEFSSPAEVEQVLQELMTRSNGPMLERLPRQPGQKEARYRHLFTDPKPTVQPHPRESTPSPTAGPAVARNGSSDRLSQLENRIKVLEEKVGELLEKLKVLAG